MKSLKNFFDMQKQSPRGLLPDEGVLRMYCGFSGAYLCVGVILIKLRIAHLQCCFTVGLLHVCGASFLENASGGLLLNEDNFMYGSYILFNKIYF